MNTTDIVVDSVLCNFYLSLELLSQVYMYRSIRVFLYNDIYIEYIKGVLFRMLEVKTQNLEIYLKLRQM